ncbi:hypothetical protein SASPL_156063 [Salvia splendens]|uniref:Uncharacterized protein n=1 Tax=Salvia splendens TaxID=180675 RepID=A0A8X8YYE0_SALSN|nr:hypothetical protein SASPL_156063 [Salvia splendens]
MATSSRRSSAPVMAGHRAAAAHRNSSLMTSDSSPFASSSYYSSSPSAGFFNQRRAASPTRVNLHGLSRRLRRGPFASRSTDLYHRGARSRRRRRGTRSCRGAAGIFRRGHACARRRIIQAICDDEFSGADRHCGGRSGEASPRGFDSPVLAPAASPSRFPAAAEPALGHVQRRRHLKEQAEYAGLVILENHQSLTIRSGDT